jgi:ketosteroid isomerase-like protein
MSQENVEIVVGQLENTNVRDFKAVMDAYADDVILRLHGWLRNVDGVAAVGREAVGEWFGDWFRTFDRDYRFEVDEARDLGDRVLIVATHHGRGRVSGAPVTEQMGYLYTVRDGKVSMVEIWTDPAHVLEAAGLRE